MKKSYDTYQQHEIHTFFLDRSLGREKITRLLRDAGLIVKVHDDYFKQDEDDHVWLETCGDRNWVVITPDTHILKDPVSMRAIGTSKARVFFLSSNNFQSEIWANALISGWKEITTILRKHKGPFIARIPLSGKARGVKELTRLGREKKKLKAKKGR